MTGEAIGILGGTFDPVHHGHLRLGLEVHQALDLKEVRMVPAQQPPHRETPLASAQQRLAMLQLATNDIEALVPDDRELQREGPSYTIDTLKSLRNDVGDSPMALIMGYDVFQAFNSWHEWTTIIDYAHIILANRPGGPLEFSAPKVGDFFRKYQTSDEKKLLRPAGHIIKVEIPLLDISSTHIRRLIARNASPQYLLPDKVIDYIKKESLYH